MTRSRKVPTLDSFYGEAAKEYATAKWMRRIQRKTTKRVLELIQEARIGGSLPKSSKNGIILDIGCGNGFSAEAFVEAGFPRIIGVDVSRDMLELCVIDFPIVEAHMVYLPFRDNTFEAIISISAMNFLTQHVIDERITKQLYNKFAHAIKNILIDGGRGVIEFYPKDEEELAIIGKSFGKSNTGFNAFLVIDKPNTRKEQKFLIFRNITD